MTYRWTTNTYTPVSVDGSFGPLTEKALQYGLGMTPTGTIGNGVPDSPTTKALQTFLNTFGAGLSVDGSCGPMTTKALEAHLSLTQDGTVPWSSALVSALQSALNAGTMGNAPGGGGGGGGTGWVDSVAIDSHTGVQFTRYTSGGDVNSWIAAACAARGITDQTAIGYWTTGYQTIASRESSGDANACNTNDSNDMTPPGYTEVNDWGTGYGDPSGDLNGQLVNYQCSRGVVQCIPQTFCSNHCPGTSSVIYDPVANIAASMGYVRVQYGVSADGHDLASKVQQADPNRPPAGY